MPMNTDIRIDIRLPRHWKCRKLKRAIGTAPMEYLIVFLGTVAEQKQDGNLIGWASADIEDAAGWDGEPGVFCAAMMAVGFLDETETGFLPHDWADHQPWAVGAEERSEKARSAAKAKWGKTSKEEKSVAGKKAASARWGDKNEKPDDAECMLDACSMHAECVPSRGDAPSPSPLPKPKPLKPTTTTNAREQLAVAIEENLPKLERLFPDINLPVAVEKLLNHYREKPVPLDPYMTALQWLQNEFPPSSKPSRASPKSFPEKWRETAATEMNAFVYGGNDDTDNEQHGGQEAICCGNGHALQGPRAPTRP